MTSGTASLYLCVLNCKWQWWYLLPSTAVEPAGCWAKYLAPVKHPICRGFGKRLTERKASPGAQAWVRGFKCHPWADASPQLVSSPALALNSRLTYSTADSTAVLRYLMGIPSLARPQDLLVSTPLRLLYIFPTSEHRHSFPLTLTPKTRGLPLTPLCISHPMWKPLEIQPACLQTHPGPPLSLLLPVALVGILVVSIPTILLLVAFLRAPPSSQKDPLTYPRRCTYCSEPRSGSLLTHGKNQHPSRSL